MKGPFSFSGKFGAAELLPEMLEIDDNKVKR